MSLKLRYQISALLSFWMICGASHAVDPALWRTERDVQETVAEQFCEAIPNKIERCMNLSVSQCVSVFADFIDACEADVGYSVSEIFDQCLYEQFERYRSEKNLDMDCR